ncbi:MULTISPECIES: DHH family phosphoesterase [Salinibaculum]|uniref:DHH family phosphoesterase n=1 Tax=Salinibaculum TaxID=2732368 RepID=UPI0030D22F24
MTDRLVLGNGSLGSRLVRSLLDRPGRLLLVTPDENRADVYDEDVTVHVGDPTDRETLQDLAPVDVVIVADEDPTVNVAAARAAREAFPDAHLLAYTGFDATPQKATLETVADTIVDPAATLTDHLLSRVSDSGLKVRQLARVLRSIDRLAIVTHDNPDPDAIASAVALGRIAEQTDCTVDLCYYGDITHQENRAFVNLLEFDLRNLEPDSLLEAYDGFALVDHSRPGVNDGLPEDLPIDVVIDHHPPRAPVEARFVDLRSGVGATSTLLVDYLERLGIQMSEDVATGLLFGIRVDTREFTREVSAADFEAAARLLPAADLGLLERIESPSISAETFDTIGSAIRNRRQEGPVLLSCVGRMRDRDSLAQAADRLLMMEGVSATLVYGIQEGTIYVSGRAQGMDVDLGEVLRDAFGRIGSAGGHADMAGAQITMGVLESVEDRDESLREIVEAVIADRFLEALDAQTGQTVAPVYVPDESADEYLVAEEELPGREPDEAAAADEP